MARIGKKSAKMNRVKGKRGTHTVPGVEDMKAGMAMAEGVAAKQRKRGFKKRRKAKKGRY